MPSQFPIEAVKQSEMNSQDIAQYESVSQFHDMDVTCIGISAESSMLNVSATDAITDVSSNVASEYMIGLPSEERYLLMNKDEVTVARARAILTVHYSKELLLIVGITQLGCSQRCSRSSYFEGVVTLS